MWARYQTATRRLIHWSTVPFTEPPAIGEADRGFPAETGLPAQPFAELRLSSGLAVIQHDPALAPPPTQAQLGRADALAKLQAAATDPTTANIAAALAAVRKIL